MPLGRRKWRCPEQRIEDSPQHQPGMVPEDEGHNRFLGSYCCLGPCPQSPHHNNLSRHMDCDQHTHLFNRQKREAHKTTPKFGHNAAQAFTWRPWGRSCPQCTQSPHAVIMAHHGTDDHCKDLPVSHGGLGTGWSGRGRTVTADHTGALEGVFVGSPWMALSDAHPIVRLGGGRGGK